MSNMKSRLWEGHVWMSHVSKLFSAEKGNVLLYFGHYFHINSALETKDVNFRKTGCRVDFSWWKPVTPEPHSHMIVVFPVKHLCASGRATTRMAKNDYQAVSVLLTLLELITASTVKSFGFPMSISQHLLPHLYTQLCAQLFQLQSYTTNLCSGMQTPLFLRYCINAEFKNPLFFYKLWRQTVLKLS